MPYLIDGSNLCGAARDRRLGLPTGEEEMVRRLAAFASRRRTRLTVVFDGPAGPRRATGRAGGVTVIYSGGQEADDRIVAIVERDARRPDITLVTSDRGLRARVRALGARVIGCREFSGILAKTAAEEADEKPLPGDIEKWARYFSGEE